MDMYVNMFITISYNLIIFLVVRVVVVARVVQVVRVVLVVRVVQVVRVVLVVRVVRVILSSVHHGYFFVALIYLLIINFCL